MICPNCGVENPVGAKFCKNCGFKLGETAPQQNNIPQPPPPPPGAQPPSPPPPPPSGGANYGGGYTQPPSQPPEKGESWWNSLIFCLLFSLFCCWPLGVVLYWINPVASKKIKNYIYCYLCWPFYNNNYGNLVNILFRCKSSCNTIWILKRSAAYE